MAVSSWDGCEDWELIESLWSSASVSVPLVTSWHPPVRGPPPLPSALRHCILVWVYRWASYTQGTPDLLRPKPQHHQEMRWLIKWSLVHPLPRGVCLTWGDGKTRAGQAVFYRQVSPPSCLLLGNPEFTLQGETV